MLHHKYSLLTGTKLRQIKVAKVKNQQRLFFTMELVSNNDTLEADELGNPTRKNALKQKTTPAHHRQTHHVCGPGSPEEKKPPPSLKGVSALTG